MADAQDGYNPATDNETTMDPSLFAYTKGLMPGASDNDVLAFFGQLQQAAKASGHDISAATPAQTAQAIKEAIDEQKGASGQQGGQTPPVDPNAVQQVNVTAKAPPQGPTAPPVLPTSQDATFNSGGPTAARLAPTDPAAMAAAQADLYRREGGGFGQAGHYIGAALQGFGGNIKESQEELKAARDMNVANTTGLLQKQIDGGSKGIADVNAVVGTSSGAKVAQDTLSMEKQKFLLDQQLKGIAVDQAQANWDAIAPMYDTKSTNSVLTQRLAEQAMGLPKGTLDGHSTVQIQAEVQGIKPATDLQKQSYDQLIAKFNADSTRMTAAANAGATNLGTKLMSNATQDGTVVPPGMNVSFGAGPTSASPSPGTTGMQSAGATQVATQRAGTQQYEQNGVGNATDSALARLRIASLKDTGHPGAWLSNLPATDAQGIKSALIGQQIASNPNMDVKSAAANADTLMKSGTSMEIMKQLAQGKANYLANKKSLGVAEAYRASKGSLEGFNTPLYTKYWNPRTGDVFISDGAPADAEQAKQKGLVPITGVK